MKKRETNLGGLLKGLSNELHEGKAKEMFGEFAYTNF